MKPIPDHITENLTILFVGFNPSIRSSETGHHFANPNNRFWKILHESGLTPKRLDTSEDNTLVDLGYGLTNIVARPTKTALEITKEEYISGKAELRKKIEKYKPKYVCFVGKGVYQEYSGKKDVPWGVQDGSVVDDTIDFVAPSSSGLVRMRLDEIVDIYRELVTLIK
ncbi:mismatch-specific DNA-glycosylase [Pseudoneobacillus rhizosphaerae]|uniref:G/U mismatch-specific DNA glycosylase n=1 Tax=Pseudoneobacillus rhizosphaerae TaxID=2880968 RepID=A0A9C7L910_9BACI|nr:mismatch-specific DNA-glycosylase [Pseudoneobacillus rhizosphaerae]CAG9606333.1 G/U mismatch-specific DNA glycosylase [Pseudoneobacillus rhizosphaerae]